MSTLVVPTPVVDVVADVVTAARAGSPTYGRTTGRAPWGLRFPGGLVANVHVVTAGACWLVPPGGEPVRLVAGDVALLPTGVPHDLVDEPGRRTVDFTTLGPTTGGDLALGGDGPVTTMLCGGYLLDRAVPHPLLAALPPVLHVPADRARGTGLAAAVELLAAEVDRSAPGAPTVVRSLVDLLVVYVLRTWLAAHRQCCGGWGAAVADPAVGTALALMHGDPGRGWSVPSLARAVGAPRATFSRRFTALTGQSPLAYLTAWRMAVAARLLRDGGEPLREVARQVGYESEFAFARAFKRVMGVAPGRYRSPATAGRRAARGGGAGDPASG
jgi:AraC-like DNA-binding protein